MTQKVNSLPIGVQKVRFSFRSHILPPLTGIMVMFVIYGLLNFPFYRAQFEYYLVRIQPPTTSSNAVSRPVSDKNLSDIIIPGINVKAPIVYEPSSDNAKIAYALRGGVVHYGTTALPGQKGNVVIFGHSSGVAWAPGDYKFVFTLLEKLRPGQLVTVHYQGVQYVYTVTDSIIVAPTEMKILNSNGSQSQLTLVTCSPVGTSKNRLVVHAIQISPNPSANIPFKPAVTTQPAVLPSN